MVKEQVMFGGLLIMQAMHYIQEAYLNLRIAPLFRWKIQIK